MFLFARKQILTTVLTQKEFERCKIWTMFTSVGPIYYEQNQRFKFWDTNFKVPDSSDLFSVLWLHCLLCLFCSDTQTAASGESASNEGENTATSKGIIFK